MQSKLVSIIIPTYNYGHLIAETLDCLIAQTYTNWEAIIINDGSTDNTAEIVSKFLQADKRFIYLKKPNKGVSSARNSGLEIANGYFIQFLDADDLISKDKISLQVAQFDRKRNMDICLVDTSFFNHTSPDILYTDFKLENKAVMPRIEGSGFSLIKHFFLENPTVIHSPLFKSEALKKTGCFEEDMAYLEDWDFWIRFATNNLNFGFLEHNDALAFVRVHPVSAMQKSENLRFAGARIRAQISSRIKSSKLSETHKTELITQNEKLLLGAYKDFMKNTSITNLQEYFQYYKEMNNAKLFVKAVFKALNAKRKSQQFIKTNLDEK
ncbi:MAG: glycosyltransferase family 2 protein [Pedobacter sp.]|nr:MAG: glycosyltransferase family 2 protein [Pedobacter sp.]